MDDEIEVESNLDTNELFIPIEKTEEIRRMLISEDIAEDGSKTLTSYLDDSYILTTKENAIYRKIDMYDADGKLIGTDVENVYDSISYPNL